MNITNVALFNDFRLDNGSLMESIKSTPSLRLIFSAESVLGLWKKLKTREPLPDVIVVCFKEYSLVLNSTINLLRKKFKTIKILLGDYTGESHSCSKATGNCFYPVTYHDEVCNMLQRIRSGIRNGDFKGDKGDCLTIRELEVLLGLCRGKTSQMIANELHISPKTIETYRANLLAKTHSNNLASLMMYSFISGLISTEVFT